MSRLVVVRLDALFLLVLGTLLAHVQHLLLPLQVYFPLFENAVGTQILTHIRNWLHPYFKQRGLRNSQWVSYLWSIDCSCCIFCKYPPRLKVCRILTPSKGKWWIASQQREYRFLCLQCPKWNYTGNRVHIKLERPLDRFDYLMAVCLGLGGGVG